MRTRWIGLTLVLLALTAMPAAARQSQSQTSRETRTLALGPNGHLHIETISGNVTVTAGGTRDVVVDIERVSRGRTEADVRLGLEQVRANIQVNGSQASIETEYPNDNRGRRYSVDVHYRVTAPAGTAVSVEVVSGNITVTGIEGALSAETVSGNIGISDAARLGDVETTSGNVTIDRAKSDGPIEVGTTSGSLRLTDISAPRVAAETVNGDIVLEGIESQGVDAESTSGNIHFAGDIADGGRYELEAHSGNVQVAATGAGFSLEATTFSGSIRTTPSLPQDGNARRRRGSVRGTLGDGRATMRVTTFSGNITVEKR